MMQNSQILGKWNIDSESIDDSYEFANANKTNINNVLAGGWFSLGESS